MRYINEQEVASVLTLDELIPLMRQTMIDFSSGSITQPTRRIFEVSPYGGFFGSMPSASANALGAKLLAVYHGNGAKGLPTHMAEIVLFRPQTGEPLAIMDGRLITEMRTAAVTACFVDAVTTQKNLGKLAIIGAGVQAQSHLQALLLTHQFDYIEIWNRNPERAQQLAIKFSAQVGKSCQQTLHNADVVIVATASTEPVVKGQWLKPGCKLASVGWSGADGCEVDAETLSHTLIVDSRNGANTESGNIRRHQPTIDAELGELLCSGHSIDLNDTIAFDSIGMACQDIAAASMVYQKLTVN